MEDRIWGELGDHRRRVAFEEQPLVSRQAVVELIGATTSSAGLNVYARLDENEYERGIKVSDAELAAVNLARDQFHGEWNYVIKPQGC